MKELQDYLCIGQDSDDGDTRAVLFVKMRKGYTLTPQMKQKILGTVKEEVSEDYMPGEILEVPDIPVSQITDF